MIGHPLNHILHCFWLRTCMSLKPLLMIQLETRNFIGELRLETCWVQAKFAARAIADSTVIPWENDRT